MKDRSGYVYETKGKWIARVTVKDNQGKRRNLKRTAKTKSEAKDLLKTLLRQLDSEGLKGIDSARLTFNDLAKYYQTHYTTEPEYFNNRKISGMRDWKRRKNMVKMFCSYFGNRKVREISYEDLLAFRTARLKTPKPNKGQRFITTVNRELACLRRIFNIALRQDWIIKNPFNRGESLIEISAERKRERILTLDEEQRLLSACDHYQRQHLKPLLICLLDTGARKGETLKLTWKDVSFEKKVITFRAMNTKSLRTRQVGITNRLFQFLEELWHNSNKDVEGLVFGIVDNVSKSFSSACKEAGIIVGGIDGITLHSLRHSAATRLIKGQMPIQLVGKILGHTQPQSTYRYLSANDETLRQAASILDSIQENCGTKGFSK
ncbi:MAG TPA: tyrosine-type recombinase/integrase [Pyrinomonadaceae bacterium]|jgi:integrase